MAIKIIDKTNDVSLEQYAQAVENEAVMQIKREFAQRRLLALTDKHLQKFMKEIKTDPNNGFTKDRKYRRIAVIPPEVAIEITALYGEEIWTDKQKLKNALLKYNNGKGEQWLTVNKNTI